MLKKTNHLRLLFGIFLLTTLLLTTGCLPSFGRNDSAPAVETPGESMELARRESVEPATDAIAENDATVTKSERKLITTGNLELEITDLADSEDIVEELIEEYSGYLSDSRQQQLRDQRQSHSYTIRVPADNFSALISDLQKLGELKDKQISSQDVTDNYIDLEVRQKNLSAQEDRYRKLLNEAEVVKEILEIEKELNRVRTEIERIENQLERYDDQINLSTIRLRLTEPAPLFNNYRLPETFQQAVQGFITSIHLIIIFIGRILPWLLMLVITIFLGYKVISKWRN
ncbi:DUF4349 domain-containing protein [Natroniella sulfidigena]|uniref:DUF4349 domain-containing protein n=1 Tax=Natroniella sulfidigena TaxID=723921 RepID=UPI00200B22EA|nr:DUF4349 domain-containing protein [Natroniella sulfidigena]MCK8817230.1 DUF4349 domain-containing protein [Natroniella sulfidigena]